MENQNQEIQPNIQSSVQPEIQPKKTATLWIIVAVLILAVVGVGAWVLLKDRSVNEKTLYVLWTVHIEGDVQDCSEGEACCSDMVYQTYRPESAAVVNNYANDVLGLEFMWGKVKNYTDSLGSFPKMHISPAGEFYETELDNTYGNKLFKNYDWLALGHEFGIQGHVIEWKSKFCWPTREKSNLGIKNKIQTLDEWANRLVYNGQKVNNGITYTPGLKHDFDTPPFRFVNTAAEAEKINDEYASQYGYKVSFEDWDGCIEDKPFFERPEYIYKAKYDNSVEMYKVCFQGSFVDNGESSRMETLDNAKNWINQLIDDMKKDDNNKHLYYYAFATHPTSFASDFFANHGEYSGTVGVLDYLMQKKNEGVRIKFITPKDFIKLYENIK